MLKKAFFRTLCYNFSMPNAVKANSDNNRNNKAEIERQA